MTRFRLDEAAWTGRWRRRATGEKAFLALGLLVVGATSPTPQVAAVTLACLLVITVAVARVRVRDYLLAWTGPLAFIAVGTATVAVTLGAVDDPVWQWGLLTVGQHSLDRAVHVGARSCAGVAALLLLAMTTPLSDLLAGLRRLGVPGTLLDVAALMYQMLFGLVEAAAQIRQAQAARLGFVDARAARRSTGLLASATLRLAWTRAHRLEDGLAGRGYTGDLLMLDTTRPVSVPFVAASALLITALAAWSAVQGLG